MAVVRWFEFILWPRTAKQPIDLMRSLGPALDGDFYSASVAISSLSFRFFRVWARNSGPNTTEHFSDAGFTGVFRAGPGGQVVRLPRI